VASAWSSLIPDVGNLESATVGPQTERCRAWGHHRILVNFRTLMGLPKVKLSKGRKGRRRSHLALGLVELQPCPQCRKPRRPHHICPNCGYYAGREVLKTD
jgi:large subunit ribosomal protein L32